CAVGKCRAELPSPQTKTAPIAGGCGLTRFNIWRSVGSVQNKSRGLAIDVRQISQLKFVPSGYSDFLHSSRQDLNLRTTLGGGYGRYLNRTTNNNLTRLGGVVYVNQFFDTTGGQPFGQNMEAVAGLQYNLTRFNFGEFNSQVPAFPGLTDA